MRRHTNGLWLTFLFVQIMKQKKKNNNGWKLWMRFEESTRGANKNVSFSFSVSMWIKMLIQKIKYGAKWKFRTMFTLVVLLLSCVFFFLLCLLLLIYLFFFASICLFFFFSLLFFCLIIYFCVVVFFFKFKLQISLFFSCEILGVQTFSFALTPITQICCKNDYLLMTFACDKNH